MYRHVLRSVGVILLVMILIAGFSSVYAANVPDLNRNGSISVTLTYEGKTVTGGSLAVFQVAVAYEENGNFDFELSEDFEGCGVPLHNFEDADIAAGFAEYAIENNIEPKTSEIDSAGNVRFDNLAPGVYLVMQNEASDEYKSITPFLVSLPHDANGSWEYHVDASPKVEITQDMPNEPTPDDPEDSETEEKIPQTGQLNWPILVLASGGVILFAVGWAMKYLTGEKDA